MTVKATEHCGECGLDLPLDVYEAQTALYGYRLGGFEGPALSRQIARRIQRGYAASQTDEEIAFDAVKEWLGIESFASLTAAVRHDLGPCHEEQNREYDSGEPIDHWTTP